MKIAVGQQALETTDRFILFPAVHEVWHVCRYKAGALKVSPGPSCTPENDCGAVVLPTPEAAQTPEQEHAARVAAADHHAVSAAERAAAGRIASPPVPPDIQAQLDKLREVQAAEVADPPAPSTPEVIAAAVEATSADPVADLPPFPAEPSPAAEEVTPETVRPRSRHHR